MFRLISVIVPVAALATAALCLDASRAARDAKPEAQETSKTATAAILRLEDALDDAESHHRVSSVQELIADDYWGITVGGEIITKADVLAEAGGREETSSQSRERRVRALGNAAVYTALVLDRGIDPKTQERYVLATRVMDVWQKRGGAWKLVNDQATGIPVDRVVP